MYEVPWYRFGPYGIGTVSQVLFNWSSSSVAATFFGFCRAPLWILAGGARSTSNSNVKETMRNRLDRFNRYRSCSIFGTLGYGLGLYKYWRSFSHWLDICWTVSNIMGPLYLLDYPGLCSRLWGVGEWFPFTFPLPCSGSGDIWIVSLQWATETREVQSPTSHLLWWVRNGT